MNILIRNLTNCRIFFRPINFNGKGTCKVPFPLKFRPLKFQCPTLLQREALTLYQHCAMLKIQRPVLFHFRRRINVISTLIHNVENTLIRRWNVGWERYSNLNFWQIFTFDVPLIAPVKAGHALYWIDSSFSLNEFLKR